MASNSPHEIIFASAEEQYRTYNLQSSRALQRIISVLCSDDADARRVIVLAGNQGIGRRYLLEAALYEARQANAEIEKVDLDLSGYEPEATSVAQFINHQLSSHFRVKPGIRERILKGGELELGLDLGLKLPTAWDAALFSAALSLALKLKVSLSQVLGAKHAEATKLVGPRRRPREELSRLLTALSERRRVVLHVSDSAQLPTLMRHWLIEAAQRNPRLILVFSSAPRDATEAVAPGVDAVRIDVTPANFEILRTRIRGRFAPGDFPDSLYQLLWRYCKGVPRDAVPILYDLVHAEIIRWEPERGWYLENEEDAAEACIARFAVDLYPPVAALIEGLPVEVAQRLRTFLRLAALCGDNVPVGLLVSYIGLSGAEADTFIDVVDERLGGEAESALFEDLGYNHAGFPGLLVYRFVDPVVRWTILDTLGSGERQQLASALIDFATPRLPAHSRAAAEMFLQLARHLNDDKTADLYTGILGWWTSRIEIEQFAAELDSAVRSGRIEPIVLWRAVRNSRELLPPHVRLAQLEAFSKQEGGVPMALAAEFHCLKGTALSEIGDYRAALSEALSGLVGCEERKLAGTLHNLAGYAQMELGELDSSLSHLQQAIAISEAGADDDPNALATRLNNLAGTHTNRGDLRQARASIERAITLKEGIFGPSHPEIVNCLNQLSRIQYESGEYVAALETAKRALGIAQEALSRADRRVAVCHRNVGRFLVELRDLRGGRLHLEEALKTAEAALGPEHIHTAVCLDSLGDVLVAQGELLQAGMLFDRSLAIKKAALGAQHRRVAESLSRVGEVLYRGGDLKNARHHFEQALKIGEAVLRPDHPECASYCNWLGMVLLDQNDVTAARAQFERAVKIFEGLAGGKHLSLAKCLTNLGALHMKVGDFGEARKAMERALAVAEAAVGPNHGCLVQFLCNLGAVVEGVGESAAARSHLERALVIGLAAFGEGHPEVLRARRELQVLQERKRH